MDHRDINLNKAPHHPFNINNQQQNHDPNHNSELQMFEGTQKVSYDILESVEKLLHDKSFQRSEDMSENEINQNPKVSQNKYYSTEVHQFYQDFSTIKIPNYMDIDDVKFQQQLLEQLTQHQENEGEVQEQDEKKSSNSVQSEYVIITPPPSIAQSPGKIFQFQQIVSPQKKTSQKVPPLNLQGALEGDVQKKKDQENPNPQSQKEAQDSLSQSQHSKREDENYKPHNKRTENEDLRKPILKVRTSQQILNMIKSPQFIRYSSQEEKEGQFQTDHSGYMDNNSFQALRFRRQKDLEKPIQFNIMIVGEQGIGKSTFIDAFLNKKYQRLEVIKPPTEHITEHKGIRKQFNTELHLTIIDTPGYQSKEDFKIWFSKIKHYIASKVSKPKAYNQTKLSSPKFIKNYQSKQTSQKKNFQDQTNKQDDMVHCCLYFLSGPRIKKIDLEIIKRLQKYVNIIPVLSKGDSFTPQEVREVKLQLIRDAHDYQIDWFDCHSALKDDPQQLKKLNDGAFGTAPPFLIISSAKKIEIKENVFIYGRKYNWGICNIQNPQHSDFTLLSHLLIGCFSLKLIKSTRFLYKKYIKEQKKNEEEQKRTQDNKNTVVGISLIAAATIFAGWFFQQKNTK